MASTPIVIKYPLDLTGNNPNNLVLAEPHTLPGGVNRAVVTNHGPFYAETLEVRDTLTGVLLTPHTQFKAIQLYQEATEKTGREICAAVVVTDPKVSGQVELNYQVVGGEFSYSTEALRQMLEDTNLDERPVKWGDLIAKPSRFAPAPHLHDAGDLYGFEYVVEALDKVRQAIRIGDEAAHEEIRNYIDEIRRRLEAAHQAHLDDNSNPHRVTKSQVGLSMVQNYPIASESEARSGVTNYKYMTPLRSSQAISTQALSPLNAHRSDHSNPHQVTKAQVGLGNVDNTSDMNKPVSTAQRAAIEDHTSRRDNPHQVTAAQVGAYSKAEANSLLNQRLPANGTAVNSNRLQGYSVSQIVDSGVNSAISRANSLYASKSHGHTQYSSSGHRHASYSSNNNNCSTSAYDPSDGRD